MYRSLVLSQSIVECYASKQRLHSGPEYLGRYVTNPILTISVSEQWRPVTFEVLSLPLLLRVAED